MSAITHTLGRAGRRSALLAAVLALVALGVTALVIALSSGGDESSSAPVRVLPAQSQSAPSAPAPQTFGQRP